MLVVAVVLWLIVRVRRASGTPEARARVAEAEAARADATALLPEGWSLTHPDRERYGFGEGLSAYGLVAIGPDGRKLAVLALSRAAAYGAAVSAINGDHAEADAWAPPISAVAARPSDPAAPGEAVLPSGWVLQSVDRESYSNDGEAFTTYGALAVNVGGERAIVVTRTKDAVVPRLVDRLEGRLDEAESWVFRIEGAPAGA